MIFLFVTSNTFYLKKNSFLTSAFSFFLENKIIRFAKSQKQVIHMLEFVRKQKNFTMKQTLKFWAGTNLVRFNRGSAGHAPGEE